MKTIIVQFTEQQLQALQTPLYVESENALLKLRDVKRRQNEGQEGLIEVLEHIQARFDAIDKLRDAVDEKLRSS